MTNSDDGMQALLDQQMDLDTEEIMKACVAKKTHRGYNFKNIQFMIWLFDSPNEKYCPLLQEGLVLDMVEAHRKDLVTLIKKGLPSKTRSCMRNLCATALATITEGDSNNACPIGESHLFSHFTIPVYIHQKGEEYQYNNPIDNIGI
jgi:hypothetical protein